MISELKVSNYKSIEKCNLEFSKINVFIGPNGSGKTSILECFEHLRITSSPQMGYSIPNLGYTKSGHVEFLVKMYFQFNDFVFRRDISRTIQISLKFTNSKLKTAELHFSSSGGVLKIDGVEGEEINLADLLQRSVFVLRASRIVGRQLGGIIKESQKVDVSNAHQIFYYACYRSEFRENIKIIKDFYSKYGLHDIRWVPLSDSSYEVIATTDDGIDVNIVDTGSGFMALFPVVVPLAFYPEGSSVFVEHPEMHLHPKLQYEIAKFFLDVSAKRDYQIFLETHSEHVLFSLLNAVANDIIRPDDLSVFSVKKLEGISRFEKLKVHGDGSVEGDLQDFIEPDLNEMLDWLKA